MKVKTCHIVAILGVTGALSSCNPFKQRVDTAWLSESFSSPQNDTVVVENGQGLAPSAAPAPASTSSGGWFSRHQNATATSAQPAPASTWWGRRKQQMAPTPPTAADTVAALPAAPVAATATAAARTYTVRQGDTLSSIAARHGVNTSTLIALNGLSSNPNSLRVGQVITLPSVSGATAAATSAVTAPARAVSSYRTHTVASGDTLSGIAARYGTTVARIIAANGFTAAQAHKLRIGQTIKVPVK